MFDSARNAHSGIGYKYVDFSFGVKDAVYAVNYRSFVAYVNANVLYSVGGNVPSAEFVYNVAFALE
jgi:hypothetical protein